MLSRRKLLLRPSSRRGWPMRKPIAPRSPRPAGGVRLPAWSVSADGGFRAMITEAAALPAAPEANYAKT